MTDDQILTGLKKIFDACFASGLVKTLDDANAVSSLYNNLVVRLAKSSQVQPDNAANKSQL